MLHRDLLLPLFVVLDFVPVAIDHMRIENNCGLHNRFAMHDSDLHHSSEPKTNKYVVYARMH